MINMNLEKNLPQPEPILKVEGLTREVDGKVLVDHIFVEVCCCDVVAIVGPSGSGKSSFLRLLNRLDEPDEGNVYLEGRDYRTIPPRQLRQQIGMVLQQPYLFPGTVADNIRFGPQQRGETISPEQIERLLEQAGLSGYEQREVSTLSGGEAQRVSVARTLANSPKILLLDEPTSALDQAAEREVEQLLVKIFREQSQTCLIVTHDPEQASRLATKVMRLEAGRLVKFGTVGEVL
jgi:putative ABC transport system ATP-binding protein